MFRRSREDPFSESDEGADGRSETEPEAPAPSGEPGYADITSHITSVLESAKAASERILGEARETAASIRREAEDDATRARRDAQADAAETRATADEYASRIRAESDELAQVLEETENRTEATREAAEEMARQLAEEVRQQRAASARQAKLAEGSKEVEHWLNETHEGLKDVVDFLEELLTEGTRVHEVAAQHRAAAELEVAPEQGIATRAAPDLSPQAADETAAERDVADELDPPHGPAGASSARDEAEWAEDEWDEAEWDASDRDDTDRREPRG